MSNHQLSAEHRRTLEQQSGISPEVIAERGYRTIDKRAEALRLGFAEAQARAPALLLPVWDVSGEVASYQLRPDEPRLLRDRLVKYETRFGDRMVLDAHPFARPGLSDPSVPLFITEGIKKGDALVSKGCCAVALLGVWNWRGTNEQGGRVALSDWEAVALNGRQVYICFDSDIMLKPQVHQALARLKAFLETRQ